MTASGAGVAARPCPEAMGEASPGLGLGLTVVDALARTLGGSLVLGRSALGGLEASILLPHRDHDDAAGEGAPAAGG